MSKSLVVVPVEAFLDEPLFSDFNCFDGLPFFSTSLRASNLFEVGMLNSTAVDLLDIIV